MWLLYQLAMVGGLAVAAPFLLLTRGRHYLQTLAGRLGRHPPWRGPRPLWLHAVSVGEVGVAATLASRLPEDLPLVITTITPTGQAQARAMFAKRRAPTTVTYLPFDLGPCVRLFLRRFNPSALVLSEGDYWPLLLRHARRRGLPVAVVNGRVGDTSHRRMSRLGPLVRPLFAAVQRFGTQSDEDRRRLLSLGIPEEQVLVTGNLKFDVPEPPALEYLEDGLRQLAGTRPLLIAGSTMAGEDELVLDAFDQIGGGQRALLVLVPRHPERWDSVAKLLTERGFSYLRRSQMDLQAGGDLDEQGSPAVLLLDSMGELAALYRVADAAFVGGTLVPTGGHNPLEPARFGIATVVGPSMKNFRGMAEQFSASQAWEQVQDAQGLGGIWDRWLSQPQEAAAVGQRGQQLVEENRGALQRTLEMLGPLITAVEASNEPMVPGDFEADTTSTKALAAGPKN